MKIVEALEFQLKGFHSVPLMGGPVAVLVEPSGIRQGPSSSNRPSALEPPGPPFVHRRTGSFSGESLDSKK